MSFLSQRRRFFSPSLPVAMTPLSPLIANKILFFFSLHWIRSSQEKLPFCAPPDDQHFNFSAKKFIIILFWYICRPVCGWPLPFLACYWELPFCFSNVTSPYLASLVFVALMDAWPCPPFPAGFGTLVVAFFLFSCSLARDLEKVEFFFFFAYICPLVFPFFFILNSRAQEKVPPPVCFFPACLLDDCFLFFFTPVFWRNSGFFTTPPNPPNPQITLLLFFPTPLVGVFLFTPFPLGQGAWHPLAEGAMFFFFPHLEGRPPCFSVPVSLLCRWRVGHSIAVRIVVRLCFFFFFPPRSLLCSSSSSSILLFSPSDSRRLKPPPLFGEKGVSFATRRYAIFFPFPLCLFPYLSPWKQSLPFVNFVKGMLVTPLFSFSRSPRGRAFFFPFF